MHDGVANIVYFRNARDGLDRVNENIGWFTEMGASVLTGEPASILRVASVGLILTSVIGLKLAQ